MKAHQTHEKLEQYLVSSIKTVNGDLGLVVRVVGGGRWRFTWRRSARFFCRRQLVNAVLTSGLKETWSEKKSLDYLTSKIKRTGFIFN